MLIFLGIFSPLTNNIFKLLLKLIDILTKNYKLSYYGKLQSC